MAKKVLAILILLSCSSHKENDKIERVVSLVPSITETIYALGKEDLLVGVTVWDDYPEEVKEKPKVGDFSNPSLERILKLNPDIVFATLPEQRVTINRLRGLGIKVFVSQPKTVRDIFKEIKEIAHLLGVEERGDSLLKSMVQRIDSVKNNSLSHRPRVYIELSANPLISIGGNSFLSEVIEIAGGENIFKDISQEYPMVPSEEVIKRDPEVIIVLHPGGGIGERLGWENVSAVKKNKIYNDIEENLLLRPGPRIVEGIEELAERLRR